MAFTWSQVRDVVDAVLELPRDERSPYLDHACPEPALRKYVDSLIVSYDQAGSFLESSAPAIQKLWSPLDAEESWVGRRLGSYEIIEEIGEGGMGSVYRAVRADDQYKKQVAVKVVKTGFENAFALARFRTERQILANLEHPNIARLLDGGTTEQGLPFFVMELVDGLPIDQYCDSLRLSVRERLHLFRSVCSAVEYAHQNLVVHRDLKPGNILITKEGTPKLLDFGIAKILAPEAVTREAEPSIAVLRILTPEYASPEQITGAPVSTATDVYSLGVVLYLLLTGRRPYQVDTHRPDEMARTICHTEPSRPSLILRQKPEATGAEGVVPSATPESTANARGSTPDKLRRQLAGDLDNIVLMALRKEPDRRYGSVEQLSEDIRRHLEGRPVRARKETLGYRAEKFISRNKLAAGAAALLLLSLSAGLVATLHQARIARAQQAKADRRFQDVRELATSLMFEVHDGIANLAGATPVRKLLVERALKYLDSLAKESKGDRSLEMELAAAYDKIGDVQGQPNEANLGDSAGAIASYEKALFIRESLAAENPRDARVLHELVTSYIRLSDLLWYLGDRARGLADARKEIPAAENLSRADASNSQNRLLLAMCYVDQGYKEAMLGGDRTAGLVTLQHGATMLEQMLAENPEDLSLRRRVALSYGRVAEIQRLDSNSNADSLASFRKAVSALQPSLSKDPNNAEIRRLVAYYGYAIGQLLGAMNQMPAALAQEREALASFQKLAVADPSNVQLQQDIALVRGQIGELLVDAGDARKALPELQQSAAVLGKMADAKDPQSSVSYALMADQFRLGKAHVAIATSGKMSAAQRAEHCRQAQSWFQLCLPQYESLHDRGPQFSVADRVGEIHREMSRCAPK